MKADEMPTDLQILLESVRGQLDRQMFEEAWRDLQLVPHNALLREDERYRGSD